MSAGARTEQCEECGLHVPGYDTIHLTLSANQSRRICTRCFNAQIAERAGVDFQHPSFEPIVLKDIAGAPHEFHFRTHHGGAHIAVEAFEIKDGNPGGYEFQVLGDPAQDPIEIFQQLFERMRRALGQTHIEQSEHGPQIAKSGEGWIVRGGIEWDDEEEGRLPRLIIDGRGYSWDEVGQMLMSFEGFKVRMEVYDKSEER